ncbi:MAG: carbamate kinase [Acidocella sp.]|uniref:carbamate kinase n=1 Tax=Acidocella sp. TaxID=50710 RepID=UPI003FC0590B
MMHIVAALGGNALLRRGEAVTPAAQQKNVASAAGQLAELAKQGHRVTLTHGNGPQVGLLALQAESGPPGAAQPLDSLDAESEGWIGYLLEQELANALPTGTEIATLLTRIEVGADDPAFSKPSKPIGQVYDEATAQRLAAERGWSVAPDGKYWRRVVPSPAPLRLLNAASIKRLTEAGVFVICAGGGGIPVTRDAAGKWHGVEAVIDKDSAGALLAEQIGADLYIMLTDVDAVYLDYGTPAQRALREATPEMLLAQGFAAGSMGPKVQAACRFVQHTGHMAAIGRLEDAVAIAAGTAGTLVRPAG